MWRNQIKTVLLCIFLLCLVGKTPAQTRLNTNQLAGQSITLKHDQNDLILEYVGIHLDHPQGIRYQYKLEGFHEDWVDVGQERIARFNNLPPGSYTFFVKAANADGVWSEPIFLKLKILDPWYWTWQAKLSFLGLGLFGLYLLWNYQLQRRLEQEEAERLRELDEVKSKLYTNITHEFRTPLAVIQGMAGQIEGNEKLKAIIQRNSINLLSLVNQMLDLSRLEAGNLPINMIQGDVIKYLNYLMESFQSFALHKNIRLHYLPEMKQFLMDYDPDKLMKIAANLISNAIKFTEADGDVYVLISSNSSSGEQPEWLQQLGLQKSPEEQLIIQVKDTGIGIPEEELEHIFDRFYQVDGSMTRQGEGTGIGLAYSRELVKLLDGQLFVDSEPGQGSSFTVLLPVTRNSPLEYRDVREELVHSFSIHEKRKEAVYENTEVPPGEGALALIVEDNVDVREYLSLYLKNHYRLIYAQDGQQGIQLAIEKTPDIVISDVMMPEKDGFELCDTLKQDVRTSHIPIVLLTAKADADSRITGLQKGADAYVAKPFNEKELLVRLDQLIANRKRLQQRYQQGISTISLQTMEPKYEREDSFILEAQKAILDELDDETFDSERLCRKMNMSASQLYRKLKALTGKSTAIYIRSVRLTRAHELLRQSNKSVSEIAYEVGFKDPAYFSRCFSEEYGVSPRKIRSDE